MQIGTTIAGRYRLDERLAAGGMGEVWRGTDTRLNRAVAVKLLHSGLSGNDRFRARFHQEAQAVAQLQAPGVVQLFDYGEEHGPDGLASYLIMELVRGRSLATVLHEKGRLSPEQTMTIVATAAEALDTAHRAHIIHRDIKPANLLVDDQGAVKIVDFGIASARGQAGLTETGTVMGTLSYASPEQLQGTQLTGATDLYSLGIVAYECLAGRPPFPGNEPTAVITAHLTGQPAPLPNDVPAPIAQIVMRCLAKDPRQRYASAEELARACRQGRPGSGTTAILPPAAMPPSTSPMTQPLPQDPDATTVQPVDRGGDTPPAGPGMPPPRDFEDPKRGKAAPILLTLAGALILILVLAIWQPWSSDGRSGDDLAGEPSSEVTEAADEETTDGDDGDEGDQAEQDQSEDQDREEPEEDTDQEDDTSPPSEEPTSGELPDVTDQPLVDAVGQLQNAGFPNVGWESVGDGEPDEGQECLVDSQDPASGDNDYDTAVTLTFWDDGTGCGM